MAIESLENLEKVTDFSVVVDSKNKYAKFTHTFKVPFKTTNELIPVIKFEQVLDTFKDVIIDALNKRMESCVDMLSRNLFNIVVSDEYHILFKKSDGSYHSFNHYSFQAMITAVEMIENGDYYRLEKGQYDQILKALYWIEKPANRKGISFGNLISACSEMIMVDPRTK